MKVSADLLCHGETGRALNARARGTGAASCACLCAGRPQTEPARLIGVLAFMKETESSPVDNRVVAAPTTGGHRKADNDAQELREQAEACRKAGQHDLARQL